jgi:hypothetical protein
MANVGVIALMASMCTAETFLQDHIDIVRLSC